MSLFYIIIWSRHIRATDILCADSFAINRLARLFGIEDILRIPFFKQPQCVIKYLIETYAVNIDPTLHKEVKQRYEGLNLKPYGGFINPDIVPVEKNGKVVDYKVVYNDDYLKQQLDYGKKYGAL